MSHFRRAILVAVAIKSWPTAARSQPRAARVGWLSSTSAADGLLFFEQLQTGLRDKGWASGVNLQLEPRWGDDRRAVLEAAAKELLAWQAGVIVTLGPAAQIAQRASSTVPVVFGFSGDPVEAGLVDSLSRPGRNLTGVSFMTTELVGKRIQLIHELIPKARRVAVVTNPRHAGDAIERRVSEAAARSQGLDLQFFEARTRAEIPDALAAIERSGCDLVLFFPVANVIADRGLIAQWSLRHRIPTVSGWAQFAEGGNVLTYGPNLSSVFRNMATMVDRILRGADPAQMPVELPTLVELVINRRTAKALGLAIPRTLLARADRVID